MSKPIRVLVTSGKGGVGKTSYATGLGLALSKRGHRTLMVDMDLDGPNCARVLGVHGKSMVIDSFMHPVQVNGNLWLYAADLHPFVADEHLPFVALGETHRMWLKEVLVAIDRSKMDYEYIIFDAPANHGDELHTIAHLIGPPEHTILVSSPSLVSTDNVDGAIKALRELQFPILGIIENFAFFACPCGCEKRFYLMGKGRAKELAIKNDIPFLGEQPITESISLNADEGIPLNNPIIYDIVVKLETKRSFLSKLLGR